MLPLILMYIPKNIPSLTLENICNVIYDAIVKLFVKHSVQQLFLPFDSQLNPLILRISLILRHSCFSIHTFCLN